MSGARGTGTAGAIVAAVLRVLLAAVFIFSSYNKLKQGAVDPTDGIQLFAYSMVSFEILPDHLAQLATFVVPWTEVVIAACLLLGFWTRAAAVLAALMLLSFIAAIASVLARGMNVECGCFGNYTLLCQSKSLGVCHIVQNTLLTAMALYLAVKGGGVLALDGARCGACASDDQSEA